MRYVPKRLDVPLIQEAVLRLKQAKDFNTDSVVRDIMRSIYCGCCAYCECKPEAGSSFEIELFYPKGNPQFEKFRKDIRNLHYACRACNTKKASKWDEKLLSPNYFVRNGVWVETSPKEIESRIRYNAFLLTTPDTDDGMGRFTINKLGLNTRPYLVENRIRCISNVTRLIYVIYQLLSDIHDHGLTCDRQRKSLNLLFGLLVTYLKDDAEYSTMILQNYGSTIILLLKIWHEIDDN